MAITTERTYLRAVPAERLPPPARSAGMLGWLRQNLFSSPGNIVLTLLSILFIVWAVPPLLRFFLFDAVWSGSDRAACLSSPANPDPGACWAFVRVWFSYFVYGFYPFAARWRAGDGGGGKIRFSGTIMERVERAKHDAGRRGIARER